MPPHSLCLTIAYSVKGKERRRKSEQCCGSLCGKDGDLGWWWQSLPNSPGGSWAWVLRGRAFPCSHRSRLGVLGAQALRPVRATGNTCSRPHICAHKHRMYTCACALTGSHTDLHTHVCVQTHTRGQSTSNTGPPTPTCRSFSFCFWKVSIISSSWWVVRLASTEALCTLVSAWLQRQEVSRGGPGLYTLLWIVSHSPFGSSLLPHGPLLPIWSSEERPSWTMVKGPGAVWPDLLTGCVTLGRSQNLSEPQSLCL